MYNEKANKLKKPFKLFSKCKLRKLTPQNFLYIFLGVENFKGLVLHTTVNLHMKCLTDPFHSILHIQCISSCLKPMATDGYIELLSVLPGKGPLWMGTDGKTILSIEYI